MSEFRSKRCYLVYAAAPRGTSLGTANEAFNAYCKVRARGVALFHDHVRERPGGGVAVFFVDTADQVRALEEHPDLPGWTLRVHALIHSQSPGAFDEQIALTVERFAGQTWREVREIDRPKWVSAAPAPEGCPRAEVRGLGT